jgi:uncharacterized Zn finger protein
MQLFTGKQLKELASPTSFERGQAYYEEGYVRKVTRKGNRFEGTVEGSYRYRVSLEVSPGELDFTCSCPYDYEGICKHCVALGLAVLAEEYTQAGGYAVLAEDAQLAEDAPQASFEAQFQAVNDQAKLRFLQQALNKDIHLRSQFLHFIQSQQPSVAPDPVPLLSSSDIIRNHIRESLSDLQFDEEMYEEYGDSYNDYYGEGEELYDMAEEMIEEVLEEHIKAAEVLLRQGKLLESARILFAVYEGIRQVEEPEADEFSLFDGTDYQEFILKVWEKSLKNYLAELKKAVIPINRSVPHLRPADRTLPLLRYHL